MTLQGFASTILETTTIENIAVSSTGVVYYPNVAECTVNKVVTGIHFPTNLKM